jgi:hypothetical protein
MRVFLAISLVLTFGFAAADRAHSAPVRAASLVEAASTLAAADQVQYREGHDRRGGYTSRDELHRAWRERMRVRQAIQARMFDEMQRVTINRARNADRAHRGMQDYLRR